MPKLVQTGSHTVKTYKQVKTLGDYVRRFFYWLLEVIGFLFFLALLAALFG